MPLPVLPVLPALFTGFLTALFSLLAWLVPFLTGKLLLFLGISFGTVIGVDLLSDQLILYLHNQVAAIPAAAVSIMKMAGIDKAMSFILSAVFFKFGLRVTSGSMHYFKRGAPNITT